MTYPSKSKQSKQQQKRQTKQTGGGWIYGSEGSYVPCDAKVYTDMQTMLTGSPFSDTSVNPSSGFNENIIGGMTRSSYNLMNERLPTYDKMPMTVSYPEYARNFSPALEMGNQYMNYKGGGYSSTPVKKEKGLQQKIKQAQEKAKDLKEKVKQEIKNMQARATEKKKTIKEEKELKKKLKKQIEDVKEKGEDQMKQIIDFIDKTKKELHEAQKDKEKEKEKEQQKKTVKQKKNQKGGGKFYDIKSLINEKFKNNLLERLNELERVKKDSGKYIRSEYAKKFLNDALQTYKKPELKTRYYSDASKNNAILNTKDRLHKNRPSRDINKMIKNTPKAKVKKFQINQDSLNKSPPGNRFDLVYPR